MQPIMNSEQSYYFNKTKKLPLLGGKSTPAKLQAYNKLHLAICFMLNANCFSSYWASKVITPRKRVKFYSGVQTE